MIMKWGKMKIDKKKIDLEKSFIHFIGQKNSFRTNIKSILTFENNSFILVKECRAELVGLNPFNHTGRYEFLGIVEKDKTHFIRTEPLDGNLTNLELNTRIKNIKNIVMTDIEYLSFEKLNEIVSSNVPLNIHCEIEYEYENIKYNLISKCEFINYNTLKDDGKYLQPIMGYVPFISNNDLRYGYVVLNITEKVNGNLEFLLCEKSSLFNISKKDNLIKKLIKKTFNNLIFFSKKNNFSKLISLKESKINFFKYN